MKHPATTPTLNSSNFNEARYGYETVGDHQIFFREAGDPENPAIVLLHGFPTSSHMYRNIIRMLSNNYYLIAPDYPGFGESDSPSRESFSYTFDNIAEIVNQFLEQRGINQFSLFIQDYGAPIGFRIATEHPEKVKAIITQNGNAYEEGINRETWEPIIQYWDRRKPELEEAIKTNIFSLEGIKWQYTHGTRNPDGIAPENWNVDFMKMSRPGQHEIQLDLFFDYQNNLKLYPVWQQYLREHQPPVLVVWGEHDAFFPAPGAEGYRRDLKNVDYHILNTGHFALEEEGPFIAEKIRAFLAQIPAYSKPYKG